MIQRLLEWRPIKFIRISMGLDEAVVVTLISRIWMILRGPLNVFFIVHFMTLSEQGYWYSYLGTGNMLVFAELGFLTLLTQYVSHEFAHLKMSATGEVTGEPYYLQRLYSLVRFSVKLYAVVIPIAFVALSVAGIITMPKTLEHSNYLFSWVAYAFSFSTILWVGIASSVLMGFNLVAPVQKMLFAGKIIETLFTWAILMLGGKLWALATGVFANLVFSVILLGYLYQNVWRQMFKTKIEGSHTWWKEIVPLQTRYAVSWGSGYFLSQWIVLLTMRFYGAELAGQLGLSMSLMVSLFTMAGIWCTTRGPLFNMCVARGDRQALNGLYRQSLRQCLLMFALGATVLLACYRWLFPVLHWQHRVLSLGLFAILVAFAFASTLETLWTTYLRAHKGDPYAPLLAIAAGLMVLVLMETSHFWHSFTVMFYGFCLVRLALFVAQGVVFYRSRLTFEAEAFKTVA